MYRNKSDALDGRLEASSIIDANDSLRRPIPVGVLSQCDLLYEVLCEIINLSRKFELPFEEEEGMEIREVESRLRSKGGTGKTLEMKMPTSRKRKRKIIQYCCVGCPRSFLTCYS